MSVLKRLNNPNRVEVERVEYKKMVSCYFTYDCPLALIKFFVEKFKIP